MGDGTRPVAGLHTPVRWPVLMALTYLSISALAILLVDVFNVAGTRDALVGSGVQPPALWFQLFDQGGLTEILQWSALAGAAAASSSAVGRARLAGDDLAVAFWRILAIVLFIMLIEDAGDPRHVLSEVLRSATGLPAVSTLVTASLFALLGGLTLHALLAYTDIHRTPGWRWRPGLVGLGLYGFVAVLHVAGEMGAYFTAGEFVVDMTGGRLQILPDSVTGELQPEVTYFALMDRPVEESVELLGASLLLTSALDFLRATGRER